MRKVPMLGNHEQQESMMPDRLMTDEAVADYLKVGLHTVYDMRKSGELPSVNLSGRGRGVRVKLSDLQTKYSTEHPLLTVSEAANVLGIAPVTLKRYVREDRLPCIHVTSHRTMRFSVEMLDAYMASLGVN